MAIRVNFIDTSGKRMSYNIDLVVCLPNCHPHLSRVRNRTRESRHRDCVLRGFRGSCYTVVAGTAASLKQNQPQYDSERKPEPARVSFASANYGGA